MDELSLKLLDRFQHLAFDGRNVDQRVEAGMFKFQVIRVRFNPEATRRALAACSECDQPIHENSEGVTYYTCALRRVAGPLLHVTSYTTTSTWVKIQGVRLNNAKL